LGRSTRTLTVSLPPQVYEEIEHLAREESKTKSELFRDMVRVYEDYLDERRWRRLKRIGAHSIKELKIASEADVEKLIHEARGIKE